ncbi:MAG: peptidase S10, partial [Candidatus Aminicenantes bacterium]|nr:peptidase S10 [Candidatus Aminicenantes bacterium]
CGYYDLATPYFAAEYTISHLGLAPSLAKNIVFKYYESGHMMYIHRPSLKKLRDDTLAFYQRASK